jgi:hypothetical protein
MKFHNKYFSFSSTKDYDPDQDRATEKKLKNAVKKVWTKKKNFFQ